MNVIKSYYLIIWNNFLERGSFFLEDIFEITWIWFLSMYQS